MDFGFVFQGRFCRTLVIPLAAAAFITAYAATASRSHASPSAPPRLAWRLHKLMLSKGPVPATSFFGYSVSLSADGHTALVGSLGALNGVYVFTLSGDRWQQAATFPIPHDAVHTVNGGGTDINFGHSVALSGDGRTALVGAPITYHNQGAVYVYRLHAGIWRRLAKLAITGTYSFGSSVALNSTGTTALVGAATTNPGGTAYLFREPTSGGWVTTSSFTTAFIDPAGGGLDNFGYSVALDRTGTTVLVGAPYNKPAAYVYTLTGRTWSQPVKLSVRGIAKDKYFGQSVALSSDGTIALINEACAFTISPCKQSGAAYVFTKAASGPWKTTRTPSAKLVSPSGSKNAEFGTSVALSGDGTTALVGAPHDGCCPGSGAAYVFIRPISGGWEKTITYAAAIPFPKQIKNNPYDFAGGSFGYAVALSGDGTGALVSGPTFAAKRVQATH